MAAIRLSAHTERSIAAMDRFLLLQVPYSSLAGTNLDSKRI